MDRREQQTELLPLLEGATTFDVVLRGYDRHQVHEHVERLEADLRIAVAERDAVAARTAELAGQVAAAHTEIDALHDRLDQVSATPALDDVSDRIRSMLSLAQQEAAEIRGRAHQEATELQSRFDQLDHEVVSRLSMAEQTSAAALTAEAAERRQQADSAAEAKRAQASEDFEIALRLRRTQEAQADEQRRAEARQEAERQRAAAARSVEEQLAAA